MKKALVFFVKIIAGIIGRKKFEKLLIFSAKTINSNLHQHGLIQMGTSTGTYLSINSELFFIKNILAKYINNILHPVLFDVGANVGSYTAELKENMTNATIYSFEPVKETFDKLVKSAATIANLYNIGFGNLAGKGILYNNLNTVFTEIATTHKDILTEVFKKPNEIVAIEFDIDTIDNFCALNNIKEIDFLKIDVEGNELAVLQGAANMLANNCIKIIQFEFNMHNIYARVFLRDFYLILNNYNFYRLNTDSVLSLGRYNSVNEIFTAQNIVAIHKTINIDTTNIRYLYE